MNYMQRNVPATGVQLTGYTFISSVLCVKFCRIQNQTKDLTLFTRSVVSDSLRLHGLHHARPASLSFTISLSLLKLMSIELVMPSNHLTLCHPLLLLPSILPSIRVFSNQSALCTRWPKHWSSSISPSDKYSGLISFRTDWFDVLSVQGTLKSLPQHHSLKASILRLTLAKMDFIVT